MTVQQNLDMARLAQLEQRVQVLEDVNQEILLSLLRGYRIKGRA